MVDTPNPAPPSNPDPFRPADDAVRAQARALLAAANHAALAVTDGASGFPAVSRIALGLGPDGRPMTLISALAPHFGALQSDPRCALMVGDVGPKGDPLTQPRLMLRARAQFVAPDAPDRAALRAHWLQGHPKSTLYVDFADFAFVVFEPLSALLNGGFGRAHRLTNADLRP